MIKNFKNKKQYGYALLELLFYIALFTVLVLVVINAMITMARAFKEIAVQTELIQSETIMERISREIRASSSITSISATDLKLNTTEFKLSGTDLQFLENNVLTGNLNTPNISITALIFTQITTTKSKAIKIFLTLKANDDMSGRLVDFYDTVVLRGSY